MQSHYVSKHLEEGEVAEEIVPKVQHPVPKVPADSPNVASTSKGPSLTPKADSTPKAQSTLKVPFVPPKAPTTLKSSFTSKAQSTPNPTPSTSKASQGPTKPQEISMASGLALGLMSTPREMIPDLEKYTIASLSCDQHACDLLFPNESKLKEHKVKCHRVKPFECYQKWCGLSFETE